MNQIQIRDNLIKLKDAGTGFMCIQRQVIEKMFEEYPDLKYANDINVDEKFEKHMYALFDTMIDPKVDVTVRDYTFCDYGNKWEGKIQIPQDLTQGHYTSCNIRKLIMG